MNKLLEMILMLFDPENLDNWQLKRLGRIKNLRDYLKEAGTIEKKKLLGELGKSGIHRLTAETYLKDLKDAGDIEEKKGKIIWKEPQEDDEVRWKGQSTLQVDGVLDKARNSLFKKNPRPTSSSGCSTRRGHGTRRACTNEKN